MKVKIATMICMILLGVTGLIVAGNVECAEQPASATHTAPLPSGAGPVYRGLAVQVQSGYEPVTSYRALFSEIAAMGANTVLLAGTGFMEHAESQQIYIEARKSPSRAEFKEIVRAARAEDLQVILMPIILLSRPRGSEWRGVIKPPNWDEWWREYREFITYYCEIAREGGATGLIVGSELVSTEKFTSKWLEVIELARVNFFGGELGYSANWDHYEPIKFWHKLDFVGMTSYHTLADHKNPSVGEIVARWTPIREKVTNWRRKIGKPIIFTEVGWCSQEGAATAPWNYYQNQKATPAGHEEQRRLYEAFLKVWDATPGVAGVIWWEWSHEPGGVGDFGYAPRGKPAEQVLREWFAKHQPPAEAPAQPPTSTSTAPAEP